jgi:methylated-DNA-[protein]-cysteine S-methyltransferase
VDKDGASPEVIGKKLKMKEEEKLTSFQQKVFKLLPPKGKITTYGKIAKKLKTSPRAVARALATNPSPIKIPCHRVIMSNGELGGYSGKGGIKRKKELLEEEIKSSK